MAIPNAVDGAAAHRHALTLSRYAQRLLAAEPGLLPAGSTARPFTADEMREALAAAHIDDETGLARALRGLRKRVMLRLIARDLGGLASLDEVVGTISALADIAIATGVEHLERWLTAENGEPVGSDSGRVQRFHVIGMGKLGGRELNVSSDVDLVFAYPEEGDTRGAARSRSNHEYFTRLARRLIALLNEMTADGYVFRVDMRLRPLGSDGPLACCFGMLENYFVTQGREWERYAWIKARVICGDEAAELLELVRPFVFRRHLDYSAFDSLRELHGQVRREVERRDILDNIKLGPGGIREIEFIVQLFQLIRGGRDSSLRATPTLEVLPRLAEHNLLPADAVRELADAYVFLRRLEHRLQYLDDKQTHTLPADEPDRALIATAMGCAHHAELLERLDGHRHQVTHHFNGIFAASSQEAHPLSHLWSSDGDAHGNARTLRELGYREPEATLARVAALRSSSRVRQMPEASQLRMRKLVPLVIEISAKLPNPDATLERMLLLLESISRREAYLTLLLQYPQTLERGAQLAHASPWAADYLARHPILLDELLDSRTLLETPDRARLQTVLRQKLDDAPHDTERQMDVLRHFKHSQTMHLLAQDLGGDLPLEKLSDYLSDLADVMLSEVLRLAWAGLPMRHCAEPRFAIVAYGKLGGKELGYASDLDLIFLHEDTAPDAVENYARLAQRLNNWLTSLTPAGVLYETDLRLRPDGASGLLVSSLEGFAAYQRQQAWVWEHQALTRARFIAGAADIGQKFESIRVELLRQPRDLAQLRAEVVAMRGKMSAAHPNTSGKFDVKHDRGGLIDVEFIVQYLVLGHSQRHAELTANIGNLALLKLAAQLGLIASGQALTAHDAYRRFRQLQHALRLQGDRYARLDAAALATEIAAVKRLWKSVFG